MPEPTQEQIEAAARAIWQTLFPHLPYQTGCSAAAQAALKAAAAVTPEQQPTDISYAEVSTDDIKRVNEHAKDVAYTPDKHRDEIGYVLTDDPRLDTIIGPPRSPEKKREE